MYFYSIGRSFRSGWNRHRSFGSFQLQFLGRSNLPKWRFNVEDFAFRHVPEALFPVYRAHSTYPGAGFGMFASRFLHEGEIVAEYTGTMKKVSRRRGEFDDLLFRHEEDGNGVIELKTAGVAPSASDDDGPDMVWCLDPYSGPIGPRTSDHIPGVWANHRCQGDVGCNLKLKTTRYVMAV
jgi:hypothetical protein